MTVNPAGLQHISVLCLYIRFFPCLNVSFEEAAFEDMLLLSQKI